MADAYNLFDEACNRVLVKFKLESLKDLQTKSLQHLIEGQDVFVIQPTGSGKSLIFQAFPMIVDVLKRTSLSQSIAIVISPLSSIMQDQVKFLKSIGIRAEFIGEDQKDDMARFAVERGECQIVFGSPESFLSSHRWRNMLTSTVYKERLCLVAVDEAHCISHWGYAAKKGAMAFRKWFSRINEIRSIVGKVPLIALTATATTSTRLKIMHSLEMKKPVLIMESPNRQNIAYAVKVITPNPAKTFQTMVQELKERKGNCDRTIVYCQSIKVAAQLYGFFKAELGKDIFLDETCDPRKRILEMFHSRIDELNRDQILQSMGTSGGSIRLLIATIAYGMGIDCKDVRTVIHYGPSYNLETYLQESGRAGRSNSEVCKSVLLYSSLMMRHCHDDIKVYARDSTRCRRKTLLANFDVDVSNLPATAHPHQCCDICQRSCKCQGSDCDFVYFDLPSEIKEVPDRCISRAVTALQKESLTKKLHYLKSALNEQYIQATRKMNVPMFTPSKFHCAFEPKQILEHCENIFSIVDIYKYVDIWEMSVAEEVLFVFSKVFGDVHINISEDEQECEDTLEYSQLDEDIFAFEVEDSILADIPQEFFSIAEDILLHGEATDSVE